MIIRELGRFALATGLAARMVFEKDAVHLPHVDYSICIELIRAGNNNNVQDLIVGYPSAKNNFV